MAFFPTTPAPELPTKDLLSWIFDAPSYDVNKKIYIDASNPSVCFTHVQARDTIRKLIGGLRHAGIRKGDCVITHSFSSIYYPLVVLAIIGSGGIWSGTNPAYTPRELRHHIDITQARFVISEPELIPSVIEAIKGSSITPASLRILDTQPSQTCPEGFLSWRDLLSHGEEDWVRFNSAKECSETTAARLTSSGTTGLPKATVTTHSNFIAQHELCFGIAAVKRPYEVVQLSCLPMFHAAVAPRCHTSSLKNGESNYIMRRFELEPFLSNIQKYQITDAIMVPPIAVAVCMSPVTKNYSLKSLKQILVGAAPLSKETQAGIRKYVSPGVPVAQVWGMTESTCIATRFEYPEDDTTGSVGHPLPGLDVKLVDDQGELINAFDTPGEMCVRGPGVIKGYFNNEEVNRASFDADGYFHTGDIMYCDGRTKLWYVVDRKKELIKVRGFQVAPPEIEGLLLTHDDIVDAAVIGVPASNEADGEAPRAYVVRRPGASVQGLTESHVYDFVAKSLAKYKRLDGGVRFVDAIPKNASGKILKRILRDQAKAEGKSAKL
ncbi:AMP-binding enzyme [Xylariales sp. PMI_506]|nr:AMP-binding enzyme [Xylariales sp. PMI_506]